MGINMRGVALLLHFLVPMFIERQLISCFLVLIYFTYMQNSTDHKLNFWHSVLWIFFFSFFPFVVCSFSFISIFFYMFPLGSEARRRIHQSQGPEAGKISVFKGMLRIFLPGLLIVSFYCLSN